jgi:hypothetical protein
MYSHLTQIEADNHRQQLIDEASRYRRAGDARKASAGGRHRSASPLATRFARVFLGH